MESIHEPVAEALEHLEVPEHHYRTCLDYKRTHLHLTHREREVVRVIGNALGELSMHDTIALGVQLLEETAKTDQGFQELKRRINRNRVLRK